MDQTLVHSHRTLNLIQSVVIIAGMTALLATIGWLFAGIEGMLWTTATVVFALLFSPRIAPAMVLRFYGTRPLDPWTTPRLNTIVTELSRRAGLPAVPDIHYLPSRVMNAFALGDRDNAAIVLSDGLLRGLSLRELTGVLAHEISHVANNDMWVMGLADLVSRLTSLLSLVGQLLLLVALPMMLLGKAPPVPLLAVLLLIAAPSLSALLQLALSRTREYQADLDAAQLTGDPRALAAALVQLEHRQEGWLERVMTPGRGIPDPSLLRTHPPTEKRIERLLALEARTESPPAPRIAVDDDPREILPAIRVERRPRWRIGGVWY